MDDSGAPAWTVRRLAKIKRRSESSLRRLIFLQSGATARQIKREQKEKRLCEARRALIETDDPIKVIQARAGYLHAPSFTRDFKKLYSQAPRIYGDEKKSARLLTE